MSTLAFPSTSDPGPGFRGRTNTFTPSLCLCPEKSWSPQLSRVRGMPTSLCALRVCTSQGPSFLCFITFSFTVDSLHLKTSRLPQPNPQILGSLCSLLSPLTNWSLASFRAFASWLWEPCQVRPTGTSVRCRCPLPTVLSWNCGVAGVPSWASSSPRCVPERHLRSAGCPPQGVWPQLSH